MTISIIIPAFNEEKYLDACLQSIIKHDIPELLEVIVVDNNSEDNTEKIARKYHAHKVELIGEKTRGPNFARETGFKASRGDIIATIDADTIIPDTWFPALLKAFSDPTVLGVSSYYDYYDFSPGKRKFLLFFWKYLGLIAHAFTGYVVYGGNFAARRSALDAIGGFDGRIVFYGDDANTGKRLHAKGKVLFLPDFVILSSARRLKAQGILYICWIYGMNFIFEVIGTRPFTLKHKNFR